MKTTPRPLPRPLARPAPARVPALLLAGLALVLPSCSTASPYGSADPRSDPRSGTSSGPVAGQETPALPEPPVNRRRVPGDSAPPRAWLPSVSTPGGAPADTTPIHDLTLEAAMATALEQHPRLASSRAELEAAAARTEGAERYPNPEAIVRTENAPLGDHSFTGNADYLLGLSQPIPLGDRLEAARTVAERERDRAEAEHGAAARDIRRAVRGAFATALYAQQATQLRGDLLDVSQRQVELIEARVEAGDAVPAELARVGLAQVGDLSEFRRVETLAEQALLALSVAIGDGAPIDSVSGDLTTAVDLPSLEQLLSALDANPELVAARADTQLARARLELEQELLVPDVRFDLLYRRIESEDENSIDVGVSFPVKLFDDGRPRVREQRARVSRAEALARERRVQLQGAARDAHARARLALDHWRQLEQEVLPRSEHLYRLVQARHAAGDATLGDELEARRLWVESRLDALQTLHTALIAWADLSAFL